jgi:type IV pilus assembly protein PilY1
MANHDVEHTNGTNTTRARRLRSFRARGRSRLVGSAVLLAGLVTTSIAAAQMDVAPPLPNVLILLDTSASMERLADGTRPDTTTDTTKKITTTTPSTTVKTRWINALEVLAGPIKNYSIIQMPRDATNHFVEEYSLGSSNPPADQGIYMPHFRPMSGPLTSNGACTLGPNVNKTWPVPLSADPNRFPWASTDFGARYYSGSGTTLTWPISSPPANANNCLETDPLGILDTFASQARFALMTFDAATDAGSGWNGTTLNATTGIAGQWSYFPGWNGTGAYAPGYGWPNNCSTTDVTTHYYETGARNPAAPPWEGPLIPFPKDDSDLPGANARIKLAIKAMRPYGATPIAPMMADAEYYYRHDPTGPGNTAVDPQKDCRGNFIILVTDGFPNLDLRPNCETGGDPKLNVAPNCAATPTAVGCCPAKRAQDTAEALANPAAGTQPVKTFVVGFALSDDSGNPVDCSSVDPNNVAAGSPPRDPGPICAAMAANDPRQPCCTLHQIAYKGGTDYAFIATDADTLRAALVSAMSKATAATSTSRTVPVFARATGSGANQYQFLSSFKVNPFGIWNGTLERLRWKCVTTSGVTSPVMQDKDPTLGDDFGMNLNQSASRNYYSWNGIVTGSAPLGSYDSIRPAISTSTDGIAVNQGAEIKGTGSAFVSSANMTAAVMGISSACANTATADECKQKLLNYAIAQPQPNSTWLTRYGNALGDIYHATPVNVGGPSSFIRDESYVAFRNAQSARTPMLLVATNDGQLHGFKADINSLAQNELWSFIPPAVMPRIPSLYGGAHAPLMDAAPVVRDVAFGPTGSTTPWGRARGDIRNGGGTSAASLWHTVAVGGLTAGGGYYALDITDPNNPKFLWQLTNVGGKPMFGPTPGTPAIGTVYYAESGQQPVETPVAFLPGGSDTTFQPGACSRWNAVATNPDPNTTTRSYVRCWAGPGQSFTVVRLYDGKILRSFRNNPLGGANIADHPAEPNSATVVLDAVGVVTKAGIDSPLTGAVAMYPGATGSVTTRAFIGDQDGTLWKADVSAQDPASWTFSIFHDAYVSPDNGGDIGQPISTAPVITVDRLGDVTVIYATGDQNNFAQANINHVWSISEHVKSGTFGLNAQYVPYANWHMRFDHGITPTGPLTLFNEQVYFTTFTPDSTSTASACLSGSGTIWAVHYLDGDGGSTLLPKPGFTLDATKGESVGSGDIPSLCRVGGTSTTATTINNAVTSAAGLFRCYPLPAGTIVFGGGITQRPSCADTSSTTSTDPYTGATVSHAGVTGISTGSFELVVQTGPKAPSAVSGGANTNFFVRSLKAPVSQTRIDSWASLVE